MSHFHFKLKDTQLQDRWYNTIIECSLQTGSLITNQNGTCKKFNPKRERIVSYSCKKNKILRPEPNLGGMKNAKKRLIIKGNAKELLKCPGKLQLSHYRKASNKSRNKLRKKANFNKFIERTRS